MSATIDDILPTALALPDDSKLLLVERILESVSDSVPPDQELLREVHRRRTEAQTNPSALFPGQEVLNEVRATVAAHSAQP